MHLTPSVTHNPEEKTTLPVAADVIGKERFAPVTSFLGEAVKQGAFPGAVFGVAHRGSVIALQAVGRFTFSPDSSPVQTATLFDLASVSKVMATTAMAMLLWQRGVLDLDSLLDNVLPGFAIGADSGTSSKTTESDIRREVTLRMVLAHASGLPGYAPFFRTCAGAGEVLQAALHLPLVATPGTQMSYSDPGFILLGKALEALAGEPLDTFCKREIFLPLALSATCYRPAAQYHEAIPPTEIDTVFRRRTVQGEVHDENCFILGGVSGHAGLFAPALDVLRFADAMLAPLRAGTRSSLFSAQTVQLFTHRAELPPGSSRALGWDTPSGSPSSSGTRFSPSSFGHLGYTGTSLWIDPVQDLAITLLTNRTFPKRENGKIQEIRPFFHDIIFKSL